jgi:hypothetical protein
MEKITIVMARSTKISSEVAITAQAAQEPQAESTNVQESAKQENKPAQPEAGELAQAAKSQHMTHATEKTMTVMAR